MRTIDDLSDDEFLALTSRQCDQWDQEKRAAIAAAKRPRQPRSETRRTFRGTPGQVERAHELLSRPGVFDESNHRLIEGIAATRATNSHGSAVSPMDISYALPMPLLCSHDWECVVGHVYEVERTLTTVYFKARVANIGDADEIWDRVCSGKIFCVSMDASSVGPHIHRNDGTPVLQDYRWCELSICKSGANPDARILRVRNVFSHSETVHRDVRPRTPVVRL